MKKRNLLERLEVDSVICAEGFLFEAERRGYLASGEFVPELALENPEALKTFIRIFSMQDLMLLKLLHIMVTEKK